MKFWIVRPVFSRIGVVNGMISVVTGQVVKKLSFENARMIILLIRIAAIMLKKFAPTIPQTA